MAKALHTKSVSAGTRIYYFDQWADKSGHPYLTIAEVPTENNPAKRERQRIFVHEEDLGAFRKALDEISDHIDKSKRQ